MGVYKEAVDELTNTVNLSVMSTNVMVTKAHELTQATVNVQQLSQQMYPLSSIHHAPQTYENG